MEKKNDKKFGGFSRMDDPAFQASRIFVGGVGPDTNQDRLAKHFGRYGRVTGAIVMKGFAFVQFSHPEEAQSAIRSEHMKEFMGKVIEVKAAKCVQPSTKGQAAPARAPSPPRAPPPVAAPPAVRKSGSECEIVCVDRYNRRYAEVVESRIEAIGMRTDVIFPNPDIPLPKILGNMAARRILLAVIVTPLNEEHRSVTVNILQGPTPQEHRNMPLDDAINFIAKVFASNGMMMAPPSGGLPNLAGQTMPPLPMLPNQQQEQPLQPLLNQQNHPGIPADVRTVLGFLLDQRPLSVMEYDKLIRFLAQKREGVLREEYGENIPHELAQPPVGPPLDPAVKAKQAELQERILNILNKPNPIKIPVNQLQQQQQAPAKSLPVEIDPSLKRAIDNLIRTGPNLLSQVQKVTTTTTTAAPAPTLNNMAPSMGGGGLGAPGSGGGMFPSSYNPLKF